MDNKIQNIKQKIKDVMTAKNMSIYQLAYKADVSEACIRNWYSKRNYDPSLETLQKISDVLGISLSQTVLDKDETLYPVNNETKELIENWLKLDHDKQQLVLNIIKSYNRV